jgi:hypothetical protein
MPPVSPGQQITAADMNSKATPADVAAMLANLTKSSVGLGNVDNTSDANKPVSTAQAAAIGNAVSNLTKSSVGLANVDNTSDANKPVSTLQAQAIGAKFTMPAGGLTEANFAAAVIAKLNAISTLYSVYWDGAKWVDRFGTTITARPSTPPGVPITAYSTQFTGVPRPTWLILGDITEQHPDDVGI